MTHLGLFEGIGGFSLAVKWAGGKTLAWCEWNEFGQKVLKYHFPEAEGYGDITKTDFRKYANKVDLLTGGFPCQPFSMAGKRKGTDDERYLWHEMLRAIQEVKPRFVIAENVFGITNIDGGLVFEQVCADLENEGYEVQAFIIPAAAKNAPHRRDRVWFIAYTNSFGNRRKCEQSSNSCKQERSGKTNKGKRDKRKQQFICDRTSEGNVINSKRFRRYEVRNDNAEFKKPQQKKRGKKQFSGTDSAPSWWRDFPLEPPVCGRNDGFSTQLDGITFPKWRAESIKAYGNAIVPQVAYELIKQLFYPIL